MKVALVHMRYSWTGGTERYLIQLSSKLLERGHEVSIVCRSRKGDADPRLKFEVLRSRMMLGPAFRMWAFARMVERHVAESDYDVVFGLGKTYTHDAIRMGGGCHGTFLELAHWPTLSLRDRFMLKGRVKHPLAVRIEELALTHSVRKVITNSEMVKQDAMVRYGLPADRFEVIYNGVDMERFHPERHAGPARELRHSLGIKDDDFAVLFLGTGYVRKGLSAMLESFPSIVKECPNARLIVAGFESRPRRFQAQAAQLGIADRVSFLGGRRDTEICYAAGDLYVLPTLYDPFATTTLEALASGLPVITTKTNGGAEILTEGIQGTILPAQPAPRDLARAVIDWSERERRQAAREPARLLAQGLPDDLAAQRSARVLEKIAEH